MKPILNLNELVYEDDGPDAPGRSAPISERIGAKRLGYNVSICPPGKSTCPFHNHRVGEEMVFVLEGEGTLRFGDESLPIKAQDFIAFPPGGREVAHQIINTGKVDLKYLALGTKDREEVAEYPDSDKVGIFIGDAGKSEYRNLFQSSKNVDYWLGENSPVLKK